MKDVCFPTRARSCGANPVATVLDAATFDRPRFPIGGGKRLGASRSASSILTMDTSSSDTSLTFYECVGMVSGSFVKAGLADTGRVSPSMTCAACSKLPRASGPARVFGVALKVSAVSWDGSDQAHFGRSRKFVIEAPEEFFSGQPTSLGVVH
jgi:hypothetical protein